MSGRLLSSELGKKRNDVSVVQAVTSSQKFHGNECFNFIYNAIVSNCLTINTFNQNQEINVSMYKKRGWDIRIAFYELERPNSVPDRGFEKSSLQLRRV
jgi:hypothetical protein